MPNIVKKPSRTKALNAYMSNKSKLNNAEIVFSQEYAVEPVQEQRLIEALQLSSAFLGQINFHYVEQLESETISVNAEGVASTSDTANGTRRQTKPIGGLTANRYKCTKMDFDTHLRYAQLDAWAHKKNFPALVSSALLKSKQLALLTVGFNGVSRAATSNKADKLMKDVNIGWLQDVRNNAPSQVYSEVAAGSGKITVGSGGDYANMDALIYDAMNNYLNEIFREDSDMVVITTRGILSMKYFTLLNASSEKATENRAANEMVDKKVLSSVPVELPSRMIPKAALITSLDNISVYIQKESQRQTIKDNPELDQVDFFDSQNVAYKLENYDRCVLIENIQEV